MRFDLALAVIHGRGQLMEEANNARPARNAGGASRIQSMEGLRSFMLAQQKAKKQ